MFWPIASQRSARLTVKDVLLHYAGFAAQAVSAAVVAMFVFRLANCAPQLILDQTVGVRTLLRY
jgi:hypothetical protein